MARTKPRYWVGVDGEGVGRDPHKYVLLAMANADGWREYIENPKGLGTGECLEFLLSSPTEGRLAGYYLGYDWTMILRDLPNESIYRLLRPELRQLPREEGGGLSPVRWKEFQLNYLAGKMAIRRGDKRVTVWDLGKYFQATFVESLESWSINADTAAIAAMKAQRSDFSVLTDQIREYCLSECRSLAELAYELEQAHIAIGLRPRAWHGPGSTAATALADMGIGGKRGEPPREVALAADRAFFGGRFEQSRMGRVEGVWGYDIVSAYPFQSYGLPCLEHGVWRRAKTRRDVDRAAHAVVRFHVRDVGAMPWAPLPCRLSNGTIVYPRGGFTGWAWQNEWRAALEWNGVEWAKDAWVLHTECSCQPFASVLGWFRERIAVGKTRRGRVLKLVLNSIYGKLAQTVGKPQFGCRVWAGMITSGTRAQLLRMMLRHKNLASVVALATDGLYSSEEISPLTMPLAPDTLGGWEGERHGSMVFVRPGIYWSDDDELLRARGIGRKNLGKQRAAVLDAIERGAEKAYLGDTTLFGGARSTIYRTRAGEIRRSSLYGEWHDIPARISLDPAPKRNKDWSLIMLDGIESAPYRTDVLSIDAKSLMALAEIFWGTR